MYKNAVMIGRFQPFHNNHLQVANDALEIADTLDIVVCGSKAASSIRDPWCSDVRVNDMITPALSNVSKRVRVHTISDHTYNPNKWLAKVQNVSQNPDTCLVLCPKERVGLFPQWKNVQLLNRTVYASDVRKRYFTYDSSYESLVPECVADRLHASSHSEEFKRLHDEYHFLLEHNRLWDGAPHPPVFVSSDVLLVRNGHVLLTNRDTHPGLGLLALPGVRVNEHETTFDAALRAVKIKADVSLVDDVMRALHFSNVFDNPTRSLIGRVITHVHYFDLSRASQHTFVENKNVTWMSFSDVFKSEDKFFEDHFHIITHFLDRF